MLQMTVVPAAVVFRNQSVQGTLVSNMADVDETLNFAKRGRGHTAKPAACWALLTRLGKLRLQPTVVGISKFNEACQALKNGKVAGRMVVDFNME
jgi:propanol-preferring alcohol dehydrogenase